MRRAALAETHKQEDVSSMCPGVKLALRFANPVMAPHNADEFILGQFTENHNVLSVCRAGDQRSGSGAVSCPSSPQRRGSARNTQTVGRKGEPFAPLCHPLVALKV